MTITTEAAEVYKDREDGIRWNPKKSEIRTLFANVDATKLETDMTNADPTAVPAIAGVNAQASITDADDPILNVSEYYADIDFGGNWKSVGLMLIDNSFSHAGQTQAGITFVSRSVGSGANGPANASFVAGAISIKDGWKTSLVSGEVDTFYLNSRQGISSDVGGILNSAQKVFALADSVANYTANGATTAFATAGVIPVTIPANIVDWPVAVYVTDVTGKYRVFSGATLTRNSGTGIGTVTFDVAPLNTAVVEIYDTIRRTLFTASGSQSAFVTSFAIPAASATPAVGEVVVFVNNVRQNKKLNNLPASTGAGYTVARNTTTGLATVTFYDTSGVLAPPTASQEVRLELAYDGGVTTNEYNAIDLVTWGVGTDRQVTHQRKKLQGISPFVEGFDGKTTYTHGHYVEAQVGQNFSGITFGAADGSFGTAGGSPYFDWYMFAQSARPVAPEARDKYQTFGIAGNGTKILMGAEGLNRKYISVDGDDLNFRNSDDVIVASITNDGQFDIAGNIVSEGLEITLGGTGNKKRLVVNNNELVIRNEAGSAPLMKVYETGNVRAQNTLETLAGFLTFLGTKTVAELNAAIADYPVYTVAIASNGDSGSPCFAVKVGASWLRVPFGAAISA